MINKTLNRKLKIEYLGSIELLKHINVTVLGVDIGKYKYT
jgi:hypothetical protein